MFKLGQKGAAHLLILLILLVGIIGGVYLVTSGPLKLFSKAGGGTLPSPETSFELSPSKSNYPLNEEISVKLFVRSDIDEANLLVAKLKFNKELLNLKRVESDSTVINNWVEQHFDNNTGEISWVGGVASPGFKSIVGETPLNMATFYFQALKEGSAEISFDDSSTIFRNSDNINILGIKRGTTVSIGTGQTSVVCSACSADIDQSGEVDIVDYSKLVACFGKKTIDCASTDVNKDGVVDIEDFSCIKSKFGQQCKVTPSPSSGIIIPSERGCVKSPAYTGDQCDGYRLIQSLESNLECYNLDECLDSQGEGTCVKSPTYQGDLCNGYRIMPKVSRSCYSLEQCQKIVNASPSSFILKLGTVTLLDDPKRNVTLSWENVPGTVKYNLYGRVVDEKEYGAALVGTGELSATVGVNKQLEYYFKVEACKSADDCISSNEVFLSKVSITATGSGDGNNDGKVDLIDLSILLTDFNKNGGIRASIDLNGDGKINTFDFSLMRTLLIQKGVIKGT